MSSEGPEALGRLDDEAEEREPSSTTEGAAAEGRADAAEGSPGPAHPVGTDFPDEGIRYGDDERRRSEQPDA